jgi:hypothetical protein
MLETWQPQIASAGSFEMHRAVEPMPGWKASHSAISLPERQET